MRPEGKDALRSLTTLMFASNGRQTRIADDYVNIIEAALEPGEGFAIRYTGSNMPWEIVSPGYRVMGGFVDNLLPDEGRT